MAAQSFAPVVLLTRPAAQSARFAASLLDRLPGLRIVTSPLIAPRFLTPDLPEGRFAAIILTSETGAMAAARLPGLPRLAYCVGDRTAEVARAFGFTSLSAGGDAESLLALILSAPRAPLLHLRGREARGDLMQRLTLSGIATQEAVVYAQEEQSLSGEAVALLQGQTPVIAPVFSPRSAEILCGEGVRHHATTPLTLIAMSAAVAVAAGPLGAAIHIAPQPTGESMLETTLKSLVAGQGA